MAFSSNSFSFDVYSFHTTMYIIGYCHFMLPIVQYFDLMYTLSSKLHTKYTANFKKKYSNLM